MLCEKDPEAAPVPLQIPVESDRLRFFPKGSLTAKSNGAVMWVMWCNASGERETHFQNKNLQKLLSFPAWLGYPAEIVWWGTKSWYVCCFVDGLSFLHTWGLSSGSKKKTSTHPVDRNVGFTRLYFWMSDHAFPTLLLKNFHRKTPFKLQTWRAIHLLISCHSIYWAATDSPSKMIFCMPHRGSQGR